MKNEKKNNKKMFKVPGKVLFILGLASMISGIYFIVINLEFALSINNILGIFGLVFYVIVVISVLLIYFMKRRIQQELKKRRVKGQLRKQMINKMKNAKKEMKKNERM